jgi:hypothetical protein
MTIAIDPGKSGGIAYRDTDGSVHAVPMPDTVADLEKLLRVMVCPESVCFIEDLPMYRGTYFKRRTEEKGLLDRSQCRFAHFPRKEGP